MPDHSESLSGAWSFTSSGVGPKLVVGSYLVFAFALVGFGWLAHTIEPTYEIKLAVQQGESALPMILAILGGLLVFGVLTVGVYALHEWCHGIVFRLTGGTPRYGAKLVRWYLPVLYATAPGHRMTRLEFACAILAPTIVVNIVGVGVMLPSTPLRFLAVIPLAAHLAGCVGDWWTIGVMWRIPSPVPHDELSHVAGVGLVSVAVRSC